MTAFEPNGIDDEKLANTCLGISIIGWLTTVLAVIIYKYDYDAGDFSDLVRMSYTAPFAIIAALCHFIAFILGIIHVIRISFIKIRFELKVIAGFSSLIFIILFLLWWFF